MITNAYSILDVKTGIYSPPFFVVHGAQALRQVAEVAREPTSQLSKYPSDFVLYTVGQYDDNTGVLHPSTHYSHGSVSAILAGFDNTHSE